MSFEIGTATDYTDLLVKLNAFLVKGHALPPAFTGTGTGLITGLIGTASSVQETITLTFSSATAFSVSGPVSGAMGSGTVGTAFSHAKVAFTVTAGGTAWVSGDTISFVMTPPWVSNRLQGGAAHLQSSTFDVSKVVDANPGTYTNPLVADLPQWGGVQLLQAVQVRSVRITIAATPGNGPRNYSVDYSDNGSSWTSASSFTAQTWTQAYEQRVHDITAAGSHKYWRLSITAANGAAAEVSELTFYAATGGQTLDAIPWFGDACWKAPGNANTDQIFVGARLKWNGMGAYWCWQLGGFTGFVAGTPFSSQPGFYGNAYLSLWNSSIPYWFIADGKSVKVVAKVSSLYEQGYLGFMDAYMAPGGYPYPMMIGGSMGFEGLADPAATSSAYRYSVNDETHRAWWCPGASGYGNGQAFGNAAYRKPDGTWANVHGMQYLSDKSYFWPTMYRGLTAAMQDLRLNLDGSVMLVPLILHDPINVFGEPDGVMTLCGNNQSVENLITVGRADWLVVQNVSRVGVQDYAAYRLA